MLLNMEQQQSVAWGRVHQYVCPTPVWETQVRPPENPRAKHSSSSFQPREAKVLMLAEELIKPGVSKVIIGHLHIRRGIWIGIE